MKQQKASQGRGRGLGSLKTTTSGCTRRLSLEPVSSSSSLINETGNQGRREGARGRGRGRYWLLYLIKTWQRSVIG